MQLLYKDYIDLVLTAYDKKRGENLLPQLLVNPSTRKLRRECLNVYNERIKEGEQVEENTLRAFFGVPPAGKNFGYVIERHPADRFRPLQSLIKKEVKNPDSVNVELLAWLIDFTPRPLSQAQKMAEKTGENITPANPMANGNGMVAAPVQEEIIATEIKEELLNENALPAQNSFENKFQDGLVNNISTASNISTNNAKANTNKGRVKTTVVILLLVAILFGATTVVMRHEKFGQMVFGNANSGCMYWVDDHYEQIDCNAQKGLVLPLNEEKMNHFKRITKEDTITQYSIGRIYYLKTDTKMEYFTMSGNHPVFVTRPLKVLSEYMFNTHLRNKDTASRNSLVQQGLKVIKEK